MVNKPLVTAQQMRALDRRATDQYGIPSLILMENAGRAVFATAVEMLGEVENRLVVIASGPGNNGGDGFVAARHLHNAGAQVRIFYFGIREQAKGDALTNLEIAENMGLDIDFSRDAGLLRDAARAADLVIDAFLGTGAKGELRPEAVEVVTAIGRGGPILAVDIPSGIDADTGAALERAVVADVTVTFALPKIGLVTQPGARHAGRLVVADIGIPREALATSGSHTYLLDADGVLLTPRSADANKGSFGHVAIVAGSVGMTGAAALAAEGALRMGAGLVTLAVPESLNDIMEAKLTEAITIPVKQGTARALGMASLGAVLEMIERRDAAVIGPGFGRSEDTIAFTLELVRRLPRRAVIDADALFALATDLDALKDCPAPVVITPHPGEMARLTGTTVAEVQSNRLEVARSFAKEHGVTVVLKGAGTVVAEPEGMAFINISGTPGMATGGTGDVLSGMIGALMAREPGGERLAACSAVYLHGRAGEIAAAKLGEESMIASDLAACLGEAIQEHLSSVSKG